MPYEPREDSYLLQKYVKKYARGAVLDVGTGTGIQADAASRKSSVTAVIGVDVDAAAISYCVNTHKNMKLKFLQSDLFSNGPKRKFDTIIFNPPYLPYDARDGEDARALSGGKNGYELLGRFLEQSRHYLKDNGVMLILFSSLTNKGMVDQFIENNGFIAEELAIEKYSMEMLYCYKISWNPVILSLRQKRITSITYLAHGKRGTVFVGSYKNKKVAVKMKRNDSDAVGRIKNEAQWLKKLRPLGIAPSLILADKQFVVYEFIQGQFIEDYIITHSAAAITKVLTHVLHKCFALDALGVSKEEMHQPYKHIIVGKRIKMIDFERMHETKKPQNVTQFVQYICSLESELVPKGIPVNVFSLRRLAQNYRKHPDLVHLKEIVDELHR